MPFLLGLLHECLRGETEISKLWNRRSHVTARSLSWDKGYCAGTCSRQASCRADLRSRDLEASSRKKTLD